MKKCDRIGPYTLVAPLGEDPEGRVWLASASEGQISLALKLAPPGDTAGRARLLREIDIAGNFDHPNIVRIHECAESEGRLWIAMEHVPGPHDALKLANLRQLLLALVHVHANGVVHANIKPANLLLNLDGDLRLANFGNARRLGAGPMAAGGMPQYMSPEQLRGEELDVRADLFSAGAVLYQILTGNRPFAGTATQGKGTAVDEELAAPSTVAHGLGISFDNIIRKVLARERAERHGSAFALLSDFDAACHRGVRTSV